MKEMRYLRDIRHPNINSFLGACVEPMRILLFTEYCARGSLNVRVITRHVTVTIPLLFIVLCIVACRIMYI